MRLSRDYRFCIFVTYFALAACLAMNADAAEDKVRTFVAYSMKVAQERVRTAIKTGDDFREKDPQLLLLGGVTKPWAIVVTPKQEDWVLLGERDVQSSVLTLDDFVVALRARLLHPEEDPGVSIDPRPCETCRARGNREQCAHWDDQKDQYVRFFGGVDNTHFGQVCFEADWMMKRVNFGLDPSPATGIETCYDSCVKEGLRAQKICSRYWFYPVVNRVNVLPDFVLLEKYRMGVFTEVLYVEIDGQQIDPNVFHDLASDRFARSFTEYYDEAAQYQPVLENLRGLTRLGSLAAGIPRLDRRPDMGFWLVDYPGKELKTRETVELLRVGNQQLGFQLSGGVQLKAVATRLAKGDATALRDLVMLARPSADALCWSVEVRMKDGMPVDVAIPDAGTGSDELVELVLHASFLIQKAEYEAAIECYDKALRLCPTYGQAYSDRGLIHRLLGQLDAARSDYEMAIKHEPTLARPYVNLGVLLMHQQKASEARPLFEKAVEVCPELAPAHNNLGITLRIEGDLGRAREEYAKAIALNPNDPDYHLNLGLCSLLEGNVDLAESELAQACNLGKGGFPRTLYWHAVSLFEQGKYAEAQASFGQYLGLVSRYQESSQPRFKLLDYGTILSSTFSEEKVIEGSARQYLLFLEKKLKTTKGR